MSTASSFDELNALIKKNNPFDVPPIITGQDIWNGSFPDLTTLNAHASDAVFETIEQVRSGKPKVTSIAFNAEIGVGKSHLIRRIRRNLQAENKAFFVYANKYGDLNLIHYQFRQILADSFKQSNGHGVTQWQELAAAMVNQVVAQKNTALDLVKKVPQALVKNHDLIDRLTNAILNVKPKVSDPDIVRAILWTLGSSAHAPFAIRWLAGKELSDAKAKELGLPNSTKELKLLEADALSSSLQIISLASDYNPILICFDELEGLEVNEAGYFKSQVVVGLVKDLFDAIEQSDITKGVALLSVIPAAVWRDYFQVGALTGAKDRISSKYKEPIELKYADGETVVSIVALWLQDFYQSHNLVPPTPVFPFEEEKLRSLGKERPTVRQLLKWCRDNFVIDDVVIDPQELLQKAYAREKSILENDAEKDWLDDSDLIAKAIYLSLTTLKGQTVENVLITDVEDKVRPLSENKGALQFRIIAVEDGVEQRIGVGVVQQTHGGTVWAKLWRLVSYETFNLTRGCLIRSPERQFKKKWEALSYLDWLINDMGGEYVHLKIEEIEPLLAILFVYDKYETYGVTQTDVLDYIISSGIAFNNPLIREILSNPSSVITADDIESDFPEDEPKIEESPVFLDITDDSSIDLESFLR